MQNIVVSFSLLLASLLLVSHGAYAQLTGPAFFRKHSPYLKFTTSTQTVYAGVCSKAISFSNMNGRGVVSFPASTLTVNLTASGSSTLYSDANCSTIITGLVMQTYENSKTIYVGGSSAGTATVTAAPTAPTYHSISQAETVTTTYPYVWTGAGGNANWSTAANWSAGAAPGGSNIAVFDGTCSSNCSPTITADPNVGGVYLKSGYTGTITQSPGIALSVLSSGWVQEAGTFAGGNSSIYFGSGAGFKLTGGIFTTTSGVTNVYSSGNFAVIGGTYNHNSGSMLFSGFSFVNIKSTTAIYNDVTFSSNNDYTVTGNFIVAGNLTIAGSGNGIYGNVEVRGNITFTTGNTGYAGTGRITLTGVNQTIDASAVSEGKMPGLAISSSGTATFIGTITIYNGGYTFNSGSLNAGTSTLKFSGNAASYSAKFGGKTYYNVLVNPWGGSGLSVAALDSIIVSNSLTLSGYLGLDMPNPGGAYSVNVTGTLNVGAGSTLSLHGASKTQGTLVNSGTINP